MQLLGDWTEAFASVEVIAGPVFDYDLDGKMDEKMTR